MNPSRHRLFNFVAVVSMLLCAASLAMLVRSLFALDQFGIIPFRQSNAWYRIDLASWRGSVCVAFEQVARRDNGKMTEGFTTQPWLTYFSATRGSVREELPFPMAGQTWHLGFSAGKSLSAVKPKLPGPPTTFGTEWMVAVPWWLVTLVTLGLAAIASLRIRSARNHARLGFCAACGYDLRATPERCPECGAVPDSPKEKWDDFTNQSGSDDRLRI